MRRTRIASLACFVLSCGVLAASAQLTTITGDTDLKTLTAADVISLLQATGARSLPSPTKEEKAAAGWSKDDDFHSKACNKNSPVDNGYNTSRPDQCFDVFESGQQTAVKVAYGFRACALSAEGSSSAQQYSCRNLFLTLNAIGNIQAARAVVENAPGCYVPDATGQVNDICLENAIFFHYYQDDPAKAWQLGHCDQNPQTSECATLSGNQAAIAAANEHVNDVVAARADQAAAAEAARQAKVDQMNARQAALNQLRDQVTANGGLIQQTANQQTAAIRAIGDQNAAQQQAQALAAQQAAQQRAAQLAQQQAQQQAQIRAQQAAALRAQQQAQQASASAYGSNGSGGSSAAGTYITPLDSACVTEFWNAQNNNWLSFTNNCGQPIHLTWIARNPNDTFGAASADISTGNFTNTGWSQTEVGMKNNFAFYACPTGYVPVDAASHQPIRNATESYVCKKW